MRKREELRAWGGLAVLLFVSWSSQPDSEDRLKTWVPPSTGGKQRAGASGGQIQLPYFLLSALSSLDTPARAGCKEWWDLMWGIPMGSPPSAQGPPPPRKVFVVPHVAPGNRGYDDITHSSLSYGS